MLVFFLVQALAFALVSSAWLEPGPEVRRGAAEVVRAGSSGRASSSTTWHRYGEGIQHYNVAPARPAGERADLGHGLFAADHHRDASAARGPRAGTAGGGAGTWASASSISPATSCGLGGVLADDPDGVQREGA